MGIGAVKIVAGEHVGLRSELRVLKEEQKTLRAL